MKKLRYIFLVLLMVGLPVMPAMNRTAVAWGTTCAMRQGAAAVGCGAKSCCGTPPAMPGKCCVVRGGPAPDCILARWVTPSFGWAALNTFGQPAILLARESYAGCEDLAAMPARELIPGRGWGSRAPPV